MKTFNCANCSTVVRRFASGVSESGRVFCSHACYSIDKGVRLTGLCPHCGITVSRPNSQIGVRRQIFCSHACYSASNLCGFTNHQGYRVITVGGKQVREHRHVIEQHIGRKLLRDEDVHHINGDKLDNSITNLEILQHRAHSLEHNPVTWDVESVKAKLLKGASAGKIAKEVGVSRQAITQYFRRKGIDISVKG